MKKIKFQFFFFLFIILEIFFFINCRKQEDDKSLLFLFAAISSGDAACNSKQSKTQNNRIFNSSFESASEFSPSYIVPQNYQSSASHDLSTDILRTGTYSHKGWIYGKGPDCASGKNCNHRGYPTVQHHKMSTGSFRAPFYFEMYVYLDMTISSGEWFSFATFSVDESDYWRRVILINLSDKGYIHLMHVPNQGQGKWTYQPNTLSFPQKKWVKISACIDTDRYNGYGKVKQDDVLVSEANISGGCGTLEQSHFGLYAPPTISSGTIYNEDLIIKEVSSCKDF
ncbi:MAG: polysaccharide lyase [Leptospiraceae bacterium]|nr:polysaccharide lyase [Leptospiraceae bacterium]